MKKLLAQTENRFGDFKLGKLVKGKIVDANDSRILLDLEGGFPGLITRKEIGGYIDEDQVTVGTEVEATIINPENDQGLVLLSLKRASQDTAWGELHVIRDEERVIKIKIEEANKGGLMARYKGLKAFLPVSQLMPKNYPRVEGADSSEILKKLQEHIGKEFAVKIMNAERDEGKIIISEKKAYEGQMSETLKNIEIGDVVEGVVTGIVKFGIFVSFGGVEGLVHVSELEWGHVSNPGKNFDINDKVEVLTIGKDGGKLSFSIKQLSNDPWVDQAAKYEAGQTIEGKITRWNDHGVFIEVEANMQGIFTLEDFGVTRGSELTGSIRDGEMISGVIENVNVKRHRLELKRIKTD